MKRYILLALILVTSISISSAQYDKGKVEISLIGNAGYQKASTSSAVSSGTTGFIFLNSCIGYYLSDGLSIEPQIGMVAIENYSPAQSVLLNLSYTGRLQKSNVALFIRGGYGIANSPSSPIILFTPIDSHGKWDVNILNFGSGFKLLVTDDIALRCEAYYRSESYKQDAFNYVFTGTTYIVQTTTVDRTLSSYGLLFGFSVLL
jgi:hypothetical protein